MLKEKVTELACPSITIQELQEEIKTSYRSLKPIPSISKNVIEKLANSDLKNISPLDIIKADNFCYRNIGYYEQRTNRLASIISSANETFQKLREGKSNSSDEKKHIQFLYQRLKDTFTLDPNHRYRSPRIERFIESAAFSLNTITQAQKSFNEKNVTLESWKKQIEAFKKIKADIDQIAVMRELKIKVIQSLASKYTLFIINVLPKVLNTIVLNYLIDPESLYELYNLYRKALKPILQEIYEISLSDNWACFDTQEKNIEDFFAEFEKFIAEPELEPEVTAERIGAICFEPNALFKKRTLQNFLFWHCPQKKKASETFNQLESLGTKLNLTGKLQTSPSILQAI